MRMKSTEPRREETMARATARSQPQPAAHSAETGGSSLLALQRAYGNRFVQRMLRSGLVQAKLAVSEPGDVYEQEADRVADQVMRMPDSAVTAIGQTQFPHIQRLCSGCEEKLHRQSMEEEESGSLVSEHAVDMNMPLPDETIESPHPSVARYNPSVQRMCTMCEEDEKMQKKEIPGQLSEASFEPIQSGGQPLDTQARSFFEPRFGYSFDQVRIHTDARAAESARAVNALAYTVGNNVVFGAGQYKPDSTDGRRLMAHELTHVVQQKAARILTKPSGLPGIQVQPAMNNMVIQRWHVSGTVTAASNTIVCNGSGGVGIHLGATGDADQTRCLSDCIRKHEESHKADALAANADICKDKAADSQIVFNGEQKASEYKAYDAEIDCLTPQVDKVGEVCKKIIQDRITQITPIRDSFK